MEQVTFRIEGADAFAAVTEGADGEVNLWCNDHCDLLHVRGTDAGELIERLAERVSLSDVLHDENEAVAITDRCLREEYATIDGHLADHDCLLLPPLVYEDGGRLCRVLALDGETLTALYAALREEWSVTVESKRSVKRLSQAAPSGGVDRVTPSLTDRQRAAFLTAYEGGYYEIPRETTTAAVADELGVDRRTAEEHLRRAEKKVVESVLA